MIIRTLKRKIKKALVSVYDPTVKLTIGNQSIKVKLSHQLGEIMSRFPDYNFNLARIVKYVNEMSGPIQVIDIGANVGDSVAFIRNYSDVPILCIDGDEKYFRLLQENIFQYGNVAVCQSLVGFETKEEHIKLRSDKGSAHAEHSDKAVRVRSLTDILKEFPAFSSSKFIKTDTDGFDTLILRGCEDYLRTMKPVLFFEFDPHFIKMNGDDPLSFINYLINAGYRYFIFYTNVGDYLLSCEASQQTIIEDLIHYFSGRDVEMYADVVAFSRENEDVYNKCRCREIIHFQEKRNA